MNHWSLALTVHSVPPITLPMTQQHSLSQAVQFWSVFVLSFLALHAILGYVGTTQAVLPCPVGETLTDGQRFIANVFT